MPNEPGAAPQPAATVGPVTVGPVKDLSASARGWHTIQLAVLGFIGVCGVLRTASSPAPSAVQWAALGLAVAALATGCLAIFTVARLAYPLTLPGADTGAQLTAAQAAARLRAGIWLTVVALILAVIAALSGWWPAATTATASTAVAVTGASGQTWCGPLAAGPAGAVSIRTSRGVVSVPVRAVVALRPAAQCP